MEQSTRGDFVRLQDYVIVFADVMASDPISALDGPTAFAVDDFASNTMPCRSIDRVKRNWF